MGSFDNRNRRKWQDYGGLNATNAEHTFTSVFENYFNGFFKETQYKIEEQPNDFNDIYVNVELPEEELSAIYTPNEEIKKHGIRPDNLIRNLKTNKTIYVELKRQDGWVEGKNRSAGRGNAHERLCKYFSPGLLNLLRKKGNISSDNLPFWIVFQGDITRDPCRVREITFWFERYKANYFFWRDTTDSRPLIEHFEKYIKPILE